MSSKDPEAIEMEPLLVKTKSSVQEQHKRSKDDSSSSEDESEPSARNFPKKSSEIVKPRKAVTFCDEMEQEEEPVSPDQPPTPPSPPSIPTSASRERVATLQEFIAERQREGQLENFKEQTHQNAKFYGSPYAVLDKKIDKGGFATVFWARMIGDKSYLAAKCQVDSGRRIIYNIDEEIKVLLHCLGAKNIVQIQSICVEPKKTFVMEVGQSLKSVIEQSHEILHSGNLDQIRLFLLSHIPRVLDIIVDLESAVSYLLSQNLQHRDIKASNVLQFPTTDTDRHSKFIFKLCDMNLTEKFDGELLPVGKFGGTKYEMHPRMIKRKPEGSSEVYKLLPQEGDFWSIGCVLYQTAMGRGYIRLKPLPEGTEDYTGVADAAMAVYNTENAISVIETVAPPPPTTERSEKPRKKVAPPPGRIIYTFSDKLQFPWYPKWFNHVLSKTIRLLFHEPSTPRFKRIADAIRDCKLKRVFIPQLLQEVIYSDLSAESTFRDEYPTFAEEAGKFFETPNENWLQADGLDEFASIGVLLSEKWWTLTATRTDDPQAQSLALKMLNLVRDLLDRYSDHLTKFIGTAQEWRLPIERELTTLLNDTDPARVELRKTIENHQESLDEMCSNIEIFCTNLPNAMTSLSEDSQTEFDFDDYVNVANRNCWLLRRAAIMLNNAKKKEEEIQNSLELARSTRLHAIQQLETIIKMMRDPDYFDNLSRSEQEALIETLTLMLPQVEAIVKKARSNHMENKENEADYQILMSDLNQIMTIVTEPLEATSDDDSDITEDLEF